MMRRIFSPRAARDGSFSTLAVGANGFEHRAKGEYKVATVPTALRALGDRNHRTEILAENTIWTTDAVPQGPHFIPSTRMLVASCIEGSEPANSRTQETVGSVIPIGEESSNCSLRVDTYGEKYLEGAGADAGRIEVNDAAVGSPQEPVIPIVSTLAVCADSWFASKPARNGKQLYAVGIERQGQLSTTPSPANSSLSRWAIHLHGGFLARRPVDRLCHLS